MISLVLIVTVAVGLQDRPSAAPPDAVWVPDYKIAANPSFTDAITAVSTIVFAYAGTPAFFSLAAEMREPRHFNKALILCQSVVTGFYLAIGIVIYYYCGSYVSSPALGSAGPVVKKVSYGFALPGLIASTLLFIHVSNTAANSISRNVLIPSRSLANTFLSAFFRAPAILPPTHQSIGWSGSVVHSESALLLTLLRAPSLFLVTLSPLLAPCLELPCVSSQWLACGYTTIGVRVTFIELLGGMRWSPGVPSLLLPVLS